MSRHVVVLNAGSSSIKFALYEVADGQPRVQADGKVEMVGEGRHLRVTQPGTSPHEQSWSGASTGFHADALQRILSWQDEAFPHARVDAVGHRVVHGGIEFDRPRIVTDDVLSKLRELVPLAPLHQPHNVAGIEAARSAWHDAVQVACFDTAFHRGHPFVSDVFALPRHYYDAGVRRYGFHGLSYEYIAARLRETAPTIAAGRVVVAHLGNGASMCAMRDGRSLDSTMGFTAADGLPMGTRTGQLDPGVVLFLMQARGMTAPDIQSLIYTQSGLKGLSGLSHDMRELEASDKPEAAQAIDYFVARIRRELGGLAAVLGGLDAVVFSAGIGENAWRVRERALDGMEWLGITLDRDANKATTGGREGVISAAGSRVQALVVPTDEELTIARHTVAALGAAAAPDEGVSP